MVLIYLLPVFIVLCYCYFTRTFNYWKKRNVVGPEPTVFFGNLKDTTLRKINTTIQYEKFYNMFPKEKVVGIYRLTTPCLVIRDLDIIKNIMIKDFTQFRDRGVEFSSSGLGKNLFHADGDTWSSLRAKFTPIFTSGKLKNMFPLINERANIFMKHLHDMTQINTELNIKTLVKNYTISTISACAFGVDIDPFESELDNALKELDELVTSLNYALEFDMMYQGILKKLNISPFPATVKHFFDNLVRDINVQRKGKATLRGDFMDIILHLKQMKEVVDAKYEEGNKIEMTDDVIAAQAFLFYVAGYETSATTMGYLLYEIARHPEIQDKLIEEIDTVMKAHGSSDVTYDQLNEMQYLKNTFLETLRMYPVLDPLQRIANVDYRVPDSDLVIKKNQIVLISVKGIHYDEKYYPDPLVFDPNRFDSKLVNARHPAAYLPFGIGPRNCIGLRFGSIQSRLGIARMLSKFRVEVSEKTPESITMNPQKIISLSKETIYLNVVPRQNKC